MMNSGAVEDPKAVAHVGYEGLRKRKPMVFSSWNAWGVASVMELVPQSVVLSVAGMMNSPLRGMTRQKEPEKRQEVRGEDLKEKK
jgi:hypothetical protein